MKPSDAIPILNQLLQIVSRSLSMYLADAKPWARPERQRLQAAVDRLVADQRLFAGRVAQAIVERGGRPDWGTFPSGFAAKHDLSLDFLARELVSGLSANVTQFEGCVTQLSQIPPLHALAEEILGNVRGHLDVLSEQVGGKAK
jgi:hypothetical protein